MESLEAKLVEDAGACLVEKVVSKLAKDGVCSMTWEVVCQVSAKFYRAISLPSA